MSIEQSLASKEALLTNKRVAEQYYGIAIPALRGRLGEVDKALAAGEPDYLASAFQGQRDALREGFAQKAGVASAQQAAGSKKALSGGNFGLANVADPAAFGAQLANALWGSRFAEGQANLDQQFNLMNMALGGAGTAGSGALGAAQNQLNAIGMMSPYNQIYASIVGGLAGAGSIYGAYNQQQLNNAWNSLTPYGQFWGLPTAVNAPPTLVGAGGMSDLNFGSPTSLWAPYPGRTP